MFVVEQILFILQGNWCSAWLEHQQRRVGDLLREETAFVGVFVGRLVGSFSDQKDNLSCRECK
jgi:hypothetical protein